MAVIASASIVRRCFAIAVLISLVGLFISLNKVIMIQNCLLLDNASRENSVKWRKEESTRRASDNVAMKQQRGHPKILWGIFTMLGDESERQRRQAIRDTYLKADWICSLADYSRDETKLAETCQLVYAFVVGGNRTGPTVIWPDDYYYKTGDDYDRIMTLMTTTIPSSSDNEDTKDFVALNIRENMNQGKTPTWFRYGALLALHHSFQYVAKCDSDVIVWTPHLFHFIRHYLPQTPAISDHIYAGKLMDQALCGRKPRCKDLSKTHLIYMSGEAYIMSPSLARVFEPIHELQQEPEEDEYNGFDEDLAMGKAIFEAAGNPNHTFGVNVIPIFEHQTPWKHDVKLVEDYMWYWDLYLNKQKTGEATLETLNSVESPFQRKQKIERKRQYQLKQQQKREKTQTRKIPRGA